MEESGFRERVEETVGFVRHVIMEDVHSFINDRFITLLSDKGMLRKKSSQQIFTNNQLFSKNH